MTNIAMEYCLVSNSSDWSYIGHEPLGTQNSDSSVNKAKIATIASWEQYRNFGNKIKEDISPFLLKMLDNFSDQTVTNELITEGSTETKFEWLNAIYEGGLSKTLAHELYPLVEKVDCYIDQSSHENLDELLNIIQVEKLSLSLLSVLLRSTAPEKNDLPSWESLFEKIINEIEVRKESAETWLRGLI